MTLRNRKGRLRLELLRQAQAKRLERLYLERQAEDERLYQLEKAG